MLLTNLAAALALALAGGAALQADPAATPAPAPKRPTLISCNIAVPMFAPRSHALDDKTARELDRIAGLILPTFKDDGVSLAVRPHPVVLQPADEAEQRAIVARRGEAISKYLAARGVPADRISVAPAVVDEEIEDNWGEGALVMLEITEEAWPRVDVREVC